MKCFAEYQSLQISEMIWFWHAVFYFVFLVYTFALSVVTKTDRVHCCFTSQLKKSDKLQKNLAKLTDLLETKKKHLICFLLLLCLKGENKM